MAPRLFAAAALLIGVACTTGAAPPVQRNPEVSAPSQASTSRPLRDIPPATTPPARPPPATSSADAGCYCSAGTVCMRQHGTPGPTRIDSPPPSFVCVPLSGGCDAGEACPCLRAYGRCQPSTQVPGGCECDNGMR